MAGSVPLELEQCHRYVGCTEAALVDTFIVPAHEGRGLSLPLSSHGINVCRELGYDAVTGTVAFDGESRGERIIESVTKGGWEQEYLLWRKVRAGAAVGSSGCLRNGGE